MEFFIMSTIMTQIVIIFTDITDLLILSCSLSFYVLLTLNHLNH